jgi:hypothetical protein
MLEGMTTTSIVLNAVLSALVVAVLARILWFGLGSSREEPSFAAPARTERTHERLAA